MPKTPPSRTLTETLDGDLPERITILSREFTPPAMEFHRRHMSAKGYRMEGRVSPRKFFLTDGMNEPDPLLEGEMYYAVTFVRKDEGE